DVDDHGDWQDRHRTAPRVSSATYRFPRCTQSCEAELPVESTPAICKSATPMRLGTENATLLTTDFGVRAWRQSSAWVAEKTSQDATGVMRDQRNSNGDRPLFPPGCRPRMT